VRKSRVPVDDVVDAALGRLREQLAGREIRTDLPAEVLVLSADPVLVGEILFNLLENAAKYSPPGLPIAVRACREGAWAVLEVRDRGPGVPEEDRERIFERFYRAPDHGRTPGTGLGLAICRAAAKAHGGRVVVGPREGGGAVFSVFLPMDEGNDEAPKGSKETA
jgi:two-component system sensor histidine kinase KdpD